MYDQMIASAIQTSREIAITESHYDFIHSAPKVGRIHYIWTWVGRSVDTVWTAFTTNFHRPEPTFETAPANRSI